MPTNPNWQRGDLILALDLYLYHRMLHRRRPWLDSSALRQVLREVARA